MKIQIGKDSTSPNCTLAITRPKLRKLQSSLFKSWTEIRMPDSCILSSNLSALVALVAKVIRPRKVCMPMDCLVRIHACRGRACVAPVSEINQARARTRMTV